MTNRNKRLELTWIGKEERPRLEPRILLEDRELSCSKRLSEDDIFDNRLIHGDNLLALKALEQEFAGQVQCVFIDPPYNTGAAFEHYDDGVEHSLWLALMRDRLELLRALLAPTGSIWITIDDTEAHYLKIVCDEVFGRDGFLGNVIWEKADSPRMDADFFSVRHDHLLVYAKERSTTRWHRLSVGEDGVPAHYDKVDAGGRKYYLKPLRAMGGQGDSRAARPTLYYALTAPDGSQVYPKRQDGSDGAWRWNAKKVEQEKARIDWIDGRNGWSPYYRIYAETAEGRPPETIWPHQEVGSNRTSKAEVKALFPDQTPFGTPKPERLVHRILSIATRPGDLVLDSFLGSGTTAAVAHKMRRRWIGIELGDHAVTHCAPRLKKVIEGEDLGGVASACEWKGGGGFRFFRLAPSLLEKDNWGNWIVSKQYNPEMLAEAMCKLEGFRYAPDREVFWNHGHSTERDFIYVTTQNLSREQLQFISEQVGEDRTLLICCGAFRGKPDFSNLTVKKIPQAVLARCEWGRDDYSLNVTEQAPVIAVEEAKAETSSNGANKGESKAKAGGRHKKPSAMQDLPLFAGADHGGKRS
jgi:adenine-specific DNA-methyltransferase